MDDSCASSYSSKFISKRKRGRCNHRQGDNEEASSEDDDDESEEEGDEVSNDDDSEVKIRPRKEKRKKLRIKINLLEEEEEEDDDDDSSLEEEPIPPEEWKELLEGPKVIDYDIERFRTKFLEHPKIEEFINWKNDEHHQGGWAILHCAILYKRLDMTKLLLEPNNNGGGGAGANVNITAKNGYTALMYACRDGNTESVRLLLEKGGADTRVVSQHDGQTALSLANNNTSRKGPRHHRHNTMEIVECLLSVMLKDSKVPVEWAKLFVFTDDEFKNIHVDTFTTQWMEHPQRKRFINWKDDGFADGRTMLLCAIRQKRWDIAKVLLEHGADATISQRNGQTPLILASTSGHTDTVKLLLDKGANTTVTNNDGTDNGLMAALMGAIWHGHTDTVSLLLDNSKGDGVDIINTVDHNGWTPLILASCNGHTDTVKLLLEKGADIKITNIHGRTALNFAKEERHADILKLLLSTMCDNDDGSQTPVEWTLLIYNEDEGFGRIDTTLFITQWMEHPMKEAFIDWKNDFVAHGMTMLLCAIKQERWDIAKVLLKHGADPNIANEDGFTPLMFACSTNDGDTKMARLLVEKGADVTVVSKFGYTALGLASREGHTAPVKLLVENGADVNSTNISIKDGKTALMVASENGHVEVAKVLIENGANVHAQDNTGMTPLHMACDNCRLGIVQLLLNHGADPNVKDNQNSTLLHRACESWRTGGLKVMKVLLSRGANANIKTAQGYTTLQLASELGHLEMVWFMVCQYPNLVLEELE